MEFILIRQVHPTTLCQAHYTCFLFFLLELKPVESARFPDAGKTSSGMARLFDGFLQARKDLLNRTLVPKHSLGT